MTLSASGPYGRRKLTRYCRMHEKGSRLTIAAVSSDYQGREMNKERFKQEATKWHVRFYRGQKNWSAAHHFAIFGSIICSVTAGAILQFDHPHVAGIASVFTSIAAALTSLAVSGGFERKWRSNRLSRSRIDGLLIDIEAEAPNIPDLTEKLKDIIAKHDQEIVKDEFKDSA